MLYSRTIHSLALRLIPIFFFFSIQAFAIEPDSNTLLADSARTLDFNSRKKLGIGLRQIGLLLQAGPSDIFLKVALERSGSWALVEELQSKGFVTVRETSMPGTGAGGQAVVLSLTAKGQAIVTALEGK